MTHADIFKEVREAAGYTQEQLAMDLFISRESISLAEQGRRKVPKSIRKKLVETLDDGFLAFAIAEEAMGDIFITKLNGERVDLHRSSVKNKTKEELLEAIEWIEASCIVNHPSSMNAEERIKLEEALIQAIDAIYALCHFVAVICREYKFSWIRLWKKHRKKLKERGYVKQ